MARSNKVLVSASKEALNAMKYEIATEMGLPVGQYQYSGAAGADTEFAGELGSATGASYNKKEYWGHISSRDNGAVGGAITARLIRKAEETLFSL